jgi:hypothetical protein
MCIEMVGILRECLLTFDEHPPAIYGSFKRFTKLSCLFGEFSPLLLLPVGKYAQERAEGSN